MAPVTLRGLAVLTLGMLGLSWPLLAHAAGQEAKQQRLVQAPHYGDVVFHFFQEDYFTATTTLMASQHFQRIAPHDDEAEVLRGGMLLSYGLHRDAGEIFTRLIERGASPAVRDRAWFYLAKIRYQVGELALAQEALSQIQGTLQAPLDEDRSLLQAQLLMARADYKGAAQVLQTMKGKTPAARVARFNLGVAQIKAGDTATGTATLDALGQEPVNNDEQRALRDRANVALGFAALAAQQAPAARQYLERVTLHGPESNKALLAYGWAALDQHAPLSALVPWLALTARNGQDSASLEARIAVPYAYAQLGASGQALQHYTAAIDSFERERLSLNQSIELIRSGQLVDSLLTRNAQGHMGDRWQMDDLPDLPHPAHLSSLLATHPFQEAFKNLRDLHHLAQHLQGWRDKIDIFKDMLATRRQAFADRLAQVNARTSAQSIPALQQRVDAASAQVAQGEVDQDGVVFADVRQQALLDRVARVQAITQAPDDDPDIVQARERIRLAAGVLNWQLAQEQPVRLWEAQKALRAMNEGLAEAQRRDAAIALAMREEPQRFDQFDARIQALVPLLDVMIPKVAALSTEQQTVVQDMAVAELTRQKENLDAYTVQARFAVAQLYDRATEGGKPTSDGLTGTQAGSSKDQKGAADAPKP
ncbi:MAG: hypothetical protein HY836_12300 [Aquabacterium sp.]|nr:hypothetical protein [Aquabacterium sp.]